MSRERYWRDAYYEQRARIAELEKKIAAVEAERDEAEEIVCNLHLGKCYGPTPEHYGWIIDNGDRTLRDDACPICRRVLGGGG